MRKKVLIGLVSLGALALLGSVLSDPSRKMAPTPHRDRYSVKANVQPVSYHKARSHAKWRIARKRVHLIKHPRHHYRAYHYKTATGRESRGRITSSVPTQHLASSVLTASVRRQLKGTIQYNGSGAFIINHNRSTLNARVSSAPYAHDFLDRQGRPFEGDSLLNHASRQYKNRSETGNGAGSWRPAGFVQRANLSGTYRHAYDRGHLLGYALVGGIRHFDASESNPRNVATQTAWANEARAANSTGQNYYEGRVRQALDQHKTVRYRVEDIYRNASDKVPSGAWIQAKSKDGSLNFNVFIPNVQAGLVINYHSGATRLS